MYIIKRYSNRRLYDPQANRSITLEDLAELIKKDQPVKVIESRSGRDITARVLGQALLADMRDWQNPQARAEILKLIIAEGESAVDILKKTFLASLGALEMTREKAEELVDTLIKKGEVAKGERSQAVVELMEKVNENLKNFKDKVSSEVDSKIKNLKVARKTDLEALEKKVDSLIEAMAKLEQKLGK